jgi:hypothetical protein
MVNSADDTRNKAEVRENSGFGGDVVDTEAASSERGAEEERAGNDLVAAQEATPLPGTEACPDSASIHTQPPADFRGGQAGI